MNANPASHSADTESVTLDSLGRVGAGGEGGGVGGKHGGTDVHGEYSGMYMKRESPSLPLGPPRHAEAIMAIEITMATEFLPERKATEKLKEEKEDEKEGWGCS